MNQKMDHTMPKDISRITLDIELLLAANEVAKRGCSNGKHPFGALLADAQGNILMEQENDEHEEKGTGHAEAALIRRAVKVYSPEFLWQCTLYTTVEPCVMCAGCAYWGNIGRVVYGASEAALLALTGDHEDNPTMSLPCREVFAKGQKPIEVVGPVAEVEPTILDLHRDYW